MAMKLNEISDLYAANLKELHSTERQLEKALGQLAEAASDENLKSAFEEHREQTKGHLERIEKLLESNSLKAGRTKAKGIEAIIAEGSTVLQSDGQTWIKDLALIDAAQRTEHHEMSLYGCTATYAQLLGKDEDARLLHQTLEEEEQTDQRLTRIGLSCCAQAGRGSDGSDDEVEDTTESRVSRGSEQDEANEDTENSIQHIQQRAMRIMDERWSQPQQSQRRTIMPRRNYDDDRGYDGREYAGHRSAQMQERDEYGQFAGYQGNGGRGNRDYDDDGGRGRGGRYSSGRSGYEGREYGGHRSAQMQERDEYGQFQGYQGGRGNRDYDDDRGSNGGGQSQGGRRASQMQDRDEYGQFQGYQGGGGGRGNYDDRGSNGGGRGDYTDSAGRHYTRESWERAQEGRSLGGQHSHGGYGGGRGGSDYDDDRGPRGGGSNRGGYGGGGGYQNRGNYDDRGDYTDSAGRHYTRESWERAQEGRSLGGQHSHGGYR